MHSDCPDCKRLWREYAGATMTHIHLEGELQIATIRQDNRSGIEMLKLRVNTADQLRSATREAFRHTQCQRAQSNGHSLTEPRDSVVPIDSGYRRVVLN